MSCASRTTSHFMRCSHEYRFCLRLTPVRCEWVRSYRKGSKTYRNQRFKVYGVQLICECRAQRQRPQVTNRRSRVYCMLCEDLRSIDRDDGNATLHKPTTAQSFCGRRAQRRASLPRYRSILCAKTITPSPCRNYLRCRLDPPPSSPPSSPPSKMKI